jgi:hypothetical protein
MNGGEATVVASDFGDGEDLVTLPHFDINLKGFVTVCWRIETEVSARPWLKWQARWNRRALI